MEYNTATPSNGDEQNNNKSASVDHSNTAQDEMQHVAGTKTSEIEPPPGKKEPRRKNDDRIVDAKLKKKRQGKKRGVAVSGHYRGPNEPSKKFPPAKAKSNPTESPTMTINDDSRVGNLGNKKSGKVRASVELDPSLLDVIRDERRPTVLESKRQIAGLDRKRAARSNNSNTDLNFAAGSLRSSAGLASLASSMNSTETKTTIPAPNRHENTTKPLENDTTPGAFRSYPSDTALPSSSELQETSLYYSTSNSPNQQESQNNHSGTGGDYLIEAVLVNDTTLFHQDSNTQNNDHTADSSNSAIVAATKESWWRRINPLWIIFSTLLLVGILGILIYLTAFSRPSSTTPVPAFAPTLPPIPTRMLAIQFLQRLIVNEIDAMQGRAFVSPDGSATAKFSSVTSMAFQDEESPQSRAVEWVVDNTVLPNIDMVVKNETKDDSFVTTDNATVIVFGTNNTPIIQSLTQQFALVTFYFSTGGDKGYWINDSGWLSSTTTTDSGAGSILENIECDWFLGFDVACKDVVMEDENNNLATNGTIAFRVVTHLQLPDNNITGNFPNEIALLSPSLIHLDISNTKAGGNSLSGTLPPSLALLSELKHVSLANHNRLFRRDLFFFDERDFYGILAKPPGIVHQNLSNTNRVGGFRDEFFKLFPLLEVFDASNNALTSSLSTEIQELSRLRILDLSNNVLTSTVPVNIDTLRFLEVLDLSNNRFTGDIDIFFSPRFSSLRVLNLRGNDFSGSLSSGAVDLVPSLEALKIGDNSGLTQGTLPSQLGLLTKLTTLECDKINLMGSLPSEVLSLTQLVTLDLSGNFLTGPLPPSILFGGQLANLTTVRLGNNRFEGKGFLSSSNISSAAAGTTRHSPIKYLDLSKNKFQGFLGGQLFGLLRSTLTTLKLNGCDLSGEIPTELGLATKLEHLELSSNTFEGTIPSEIVNLRSFRVLDLSANVLVGRLPELFERASSLEHLNLNFNLLTGTLTPRNLENLTSISIRSNEITGSFPTMIAVSNLEHADLGGIQFTGTLPGLIGLLTKLTTLLLDFNRFSGSIPSGINKLSALRRVDLSSNNLNATLPSEIGLLSQLTSLDLSRNLFSGMIPSELVNLGSLRTFRINSNELSGFIPTSICGFEVRSLSVVDCDTVECGCCGCPESTPEEPILPTTFPTLSPIISVPVNDVPTLQTNVPSTSATPSLTDEVLCGLQIGCIECASITENLPFRQECIDTLLSMKFRFTGGGCSESNNSQPPSLFTCNDIDAGGPPSSPTKPSFVVVQDIRTGTIYHESLVSPGSEYALAVPARESVGSRLNITVYSSPEATFGTQLQSIIFDSSCARGILFLGDRFGSHELIEFRNEEQEVVSIFQDLTLAVTVKNLGERTFSLVSLLSVGSNGLTNLTDIAGGTVLMGGESAVFEYSDVLDTGTSEIYTQLVSLRVSGVGKSGAKCNAQKLFRLLDG